MVLGAIFLWSTIEVGSILQRGKTSETVLSWKMIPCVMKKPLVLAILVILVSTSSAGCLSLEWVRSSFLPASPFQTIVLENYTNISYTFNTNPDNPDSLVFNTARDVVVPEDPLHIDVRVMVQIDNLPTAIDFSEVLEMLGVEREVNVSLFKPDGRAFFSKVYNTTTAHPDQWVKIPSPETGTWRIVVKSEGVGHSSISYHDNFSIVVVVRAERIV